MDSNSFQSESDCKFVLRQDVPNGMFVNPDEIAELIRKRKLSSYVHGSIDIEAPAHEAKDHIVYIYLNSTGIERTSIVLPIHLRYQRIWCSGSLNKVCGRELKIEAPCDESNQNVCIWKNLTYQALFDEVELFVPVGDLDDYLVVSLVTLFLGCAGCIYILFRKVYEGSQNRGLS
ncbi:hypothetical protein JTB14_024472 [Gonioctena quinquepunctata]|nr:hypothetical protein JTB14_024472 [Gonioctena quinquepunctata]